MDAEMWVTERSYHNSVGTTFKIKNVLHREKSPFQTIEVLDTEAVGRLLMLDGKCMLSDADEFVYHEIMAHIPSMLLPKMKNVLIIGGGDGGVVREFVKHSDVESIELVEIDERVIEVSRQFLPHCTSGLDDKRVTIVAKDGLKFIKEKKNHYDVIIVDSTDPEDFASELFTAKFYQDVFDALNEQGIMLCQSENPFYDQYDIGQIYGNMRKVFPVVKSCYAPMLVYPGIYWTFGFCSKGILPTQLQEAKIPAMKELQKTLKWYNLDWHRGAFLLGNIHKRKIGEEL